jgi:DNA-directed RNA polymerase subunit RPC12/RpoP
MIVRCGRCRSELEIPGPGEFVCPACGTRNVAKGGAAADPFSIADNPAASGLTVPGGAPVPAPPPGPPVDIRWGVCPSCGHRFAMGEVERITCPNCRAELASSPDGALSLDAP